TVCHMLAVTDSPQARPRTKTEAKDPGPRYSSPSSVKRQAVVAADSCTGTEAALLLPFEREEEEVVAHRSGPGPARGMGGDGLQRCRPPGDGVCRCHRFDHRFQPPHRGSPGEERAAGGDGGNISCSLDDF